MASVWLNEHCVGHLDACTVFSCFLRCGGSKGLGYPESDERQAAYWSEPLRNRYFSIAERCDKETMLQRQYTPDCLRKRNQYRVDHADIVLAVWNGSPSGTGQTVWYAKKTGKPVWILRPNTLEVQ